MNPRSAHEQARARSYGFCGLFLWALLGLGLEAAHGFKWAPYLDDPLARELLRLAHAHGVVLSIVCFAYASWGVPLFSARPDAGRPVRLLLGFAWLAIPVGFASSIFGHSEADPGPAIWLVPPAGVCLLIALGWSAIASIRHPRSPE